MAKSLRLHHREASGLGKGQGLLRPIDILLLPWGCPEPADQLWALGPRITAGNPQLPVAGDELTWPRATRPLRS